MLKAYTKKAEESWVAPEIPDMLRAEDNSTTEIPGFLRRRDKEQIKPWEPAYQADEYQKRGLSLDGGTTNPQVSEAKKTNSILQELHKILKRIAEKTGDNW